MSKIEVFIFHALGLMLCPVGWVVGIFIKEQKMSERWKPESGELYYFISTAGDIIPERFYNYEAGSRSRFLHGNVFKTKAAAESAAEKVKALLLSLHGECENLQPTCNQLATGLPKLTAEVFDCPDCPAEATFAVVYQDGSASYMKGDHAKMKSKEMHWSYTLSSGIEDLGEIPGKFDPSDWKNSIVERPAKALPDWCKDGALAWENGDYFKLGVIDADHRVTMMYSDGTEESVDPDYIVKHVSPARLRPYNAEEMRRLVGKVIERRSSAYLVISYAHDDLETTVYIEGKYLCADNLLRDFTINGEPCGCLEHFENGEWVK